LKELEAVFHVSWGIASKLGERLAAHKCCGKSRLQSPDVRIDVPTWFVKAMSHVAHVTPCYVYQAPGTSFVM